MDTKLLAGIPLWIFFYKSGVHATISGVLLALAVPARVKMDRYEFVRRTRSAIAHIDEGGIKEGVEEVLTSDQHASLNEIERACKAVQMPLERIENHLHPWVTFCIVPLFAFTNAGLAIASDSLGKLQQPLGIGIVLGLLVGKPVGIFVCSWLAVKLRIADLPRGVSWRQIFGVGVLGGIGFTMSLFIAGLAFGTGENLQVAKFAILTASLLAGIIGYVILVGAPRGRAVRSENVA